MNSPKKFTNEELNDIRARFSAGLEGAESFIAWLNAYMLDDFRWMLGTLDWYVENETFENKPQKDD